MWYVAADPFEQVVLYETDVYSWPYGMAGFGDLGRHGHQGHKAKRLRPVDAKGRVIPAPPGSGRQAYQYGQDDAQQAVAAQELSNSQTAASRWQRPITASSGADQLIARGAVIGPGIGKEAYDARERQRTLDKLPGVVDRLISQQQPTPKLPPDPREQLALDRAAQLRQQAVQQTQQVPSVPSPIGGGWNPFQFNSGR